MKKSVLQMLRLVLLVAGLLPFAVRAEEAGVLLWMIDNPVIDRFGTEYGVADYVDPAGLSVNAARVAVTGDDGATVYLNLYKDAGDGDMVLTDKSVAFLANDPDLGVQTAEIWASVAGMTADSYSYAIELGAMSGGAFTVLAVSDAQTYAQLRDRFVSVDPLLYPVDAWTPHTYAVPEPTGGVLMLLGVALLALRRKEVCL